MLPPKQINDYCLHKLVVYNHGNGGWLGIIGRTSNSLSSKLKSKSLFINNSALRLFSCLLFLICQFRCGGLSLLQLYMTSLFKLSSTL